MSSATHAQHRLRPGAHHDGVGSVRDEIADLKETIQTGVHDASANTGRVLRAARSAASEAVDGLRRSAYSYHQRAGRAISERPWTSVALAAAAGAAFAGAFFLFRGRRS